MMNKSSKGASDSKDPFGRLPNDVLFLIFTKLPEDIKFLSQCFLVSRRFASTICCLPAVSITLPSLPPDLVRAFLLEPLSMNDLRSLVKSSYAKTTNLLNKFANLRSLDVVVPSDARNDGDNDDDGARGFCNFKVKVETDFYTMVYLQSNHIHRRVEENPGFAYGLGLTSMMMSLRFVTDSIIWHDLLVMVTQDYPMLQSVSISDAKKTRKISFSGEEYLKLKTLVATMKEEVESFFPGENIYLKMATVPQLLLPVSGYVMEDVMVHIVSVSCRRGKVPENEDDILGWEYGEEEKVFGEAIVTILKNYKDKLITDW